MALVEGGFDALPSTSQSGVLCNSFFQQHYYLIPVLTGSALFYMISITKIFTGDILTVRSPELQIIVRFGVKLCGHLVPTFIPSSFYIYG
jgi:hypothetical protein